jgi:ABC-type siderophore export system fused ATPase/permease subunit
MRRLADDDDVTVLAVSHDDRLDRVADRRLVMKDGRITELARPDLRESAPSPAPLT